MPKIVHNVLCGFCGFNRSKSACGRAVTVGACEFGSALLGTLSVLGIGAVGGFEPKEFSLWGSQVIAGIGGQADTLLSRSIKVGLRRKLPQGIVTKLPFDLYEKNVGIRRRALRWAEDNAERVTALNIEAPSGASDRAQDKLTALFRLAQAASQT